LKLLKNEKTNDLCLIQDNDELLIYQSHVVDPNYLDALSPDDFECDAQIKMLGNNKIEVLQLQTLRQFNNSHDFLRIIELLTDGLEFNGYDVSTVKPYLENPSSFTGEVIFNVEISQIKEDEKKAPGAKYKFEFKGKRITGDSAYIKYTFFNDGLETLPTSLYEIFALYANLSKVIAQACHEGKDEWFMPCDDWATIPYGKEAIYSSHNRQKQF